MVKGTVSPMADGGQEETAKEGQEAAVGEGPSTIAEVVAWARTRVAHLAGVRADAVKLDLRIEY